MIQNNKHRDDKLIYIHVCVCIFDKIYAIQDFASVLNYNLYN